MNQIIDPDFWLKSLVNASHQLADSGNRQIKVLTIVQPPGQDAMLVAPGIPGVNAFDLREVKALVDKMVDDAEKQAKKPEVAEIPTKKPAPKARKR